MSQQSDHSTRLLVVASMTALGALGILVGLLLGIITFGLVGTALSLSAESISGQLVFAVGTYVGLSAVGGIYLLRYELGLSYVRFNRPSIRDLLFTVLTVVVLLVLAISISVLAERFGVPFTDHTITDSIEANPTVALAFIPVSLFVVGPAEEFLYRGIIQTRLRDVFGTKSAIVIASLVFAVVHVFAYLDPTNLAGTLVTIFFILLPLGAILGVVYEYTGNLLVPVAAHGIYNAVTFGLTYADTVGIF